MLEAKLKKGIVLRRINANTNEYWHFIARWYAMRIFQGGAQ